VIMETDHFIVLAPYASEHPFESTIIPKYHAPRFEDSSDNELRELAYVLKAVMANIYIRLNDPAVNFYLHSMPFARTKNLVHEQNAHRWHISIFPRLVIWAGFELGTGIAINPVTPEDATQLLK
jgi:UDPglucose--hexose-1-phosphate uridylyltransferase